MRTGVCGVHLTFGQKVEGYCDIPVSSCSYCNCNFMSQSWKLYSTFSGEINQLSNCMTN